MLSSAPLAFVLSGAVHMHRGAMTALTERLLSLQREKWLCILHACRCRVKQWCAEMLVPNSGQCAISALDAGDSCNSGSGMQHGVCAAVIVCSCVNRLACLPSMLLTVVLMPSLSWCCRALRACITTLVYRIRGGKFRLAGARKRL